MSDTKWFLPDEYKKNIKWKKRKKVPQWYIDLLNGKPIKVGMMIKDWRFFKGSCAE